MVNVTISRDPDKIASLNSGGGGAGGHFTYTGTVKGENEFVWKLQKKVNALCIRQIFILALQSVNLTKFTTTQR